MTPGAGTEFQRDEYFNKALTLSRHGYWKEALAAYKESLRINPNNPETYLNLGFVFYELGYDQEAQEAFEKAARCRGRL